MIPAVIATCQRVWEKIDRLRAEGDRLKAWLPGIRPCTHKPDGVMWRKQCPLCPYSDRVRAAAQYVACADRRLISRPLIPGIWC